ncbi:MAG: hypothetical protein K6B17_02340 [Treponema sp.]|nr:hypothetical protein [Treponema sp.]
MITLFVGLLLIAFCVFACLSNGLNWSVEIIRFLKGFGPCFAAFVGLIAVFIGFADIKDKKEAKKEAEKENESK